MPTRKLRVIQYIPHTIRLILHQEPTSTVNCKLRGEIVAYEDAPYGCGVFVAVFLYLNYTRREYLNYTRITSRPSPSCMPTSLKLALAWLRSYGSRTVYRRRTVGVIDTPTFLVPCKICRVTVLLLAELLYQRQEGCPFAAYVG
jgi:hypothetical protein